MFNFAVALCGKMWTNAGTSQTGGVSSSVPTTPVDSSVPAGKAIKYERTTSPSVSVSQIVRYTQEARLSVWPGLERMSSILNSLPFQRCVTLRATTTECALLRTVVTVPWVTQDQDAQVQNGVISFFAQNYCKPGENASLATLHHFPQPCYRFRQMQKWMMQIGIYLVF